MPSFNFSIFLKLAGKNITVAPILMAGATPKESRKEISRPDKFCQYFDMGDVKYDKVEKRVVLQIRKTKKG